MYFIFHRFIRNNEVLNKDKMMGVLYHDLPTRGAYEMSDFR